MPASPAHEIDFLLLAPLQEEREALLAHLPSPERGSDSVNVLGSGNVVGVGSISGSGHQITVNVNSGKEPEASSPHARAPSAAPGPTAESLRTLLYDVLRLDSDFDAFCIDYFPTTARLLSSGMDGQQKRNLLLKNEDAAEILDRLRQAHPAAFAKYAHLVRAALPRPAAAAPDSRGGAWAGPLHEVLRTELIAQLLDRLEQQRRLLILSPRRGGARTLVRQMVAHCSFAADAITQLSPSPLAKNAAEYFAALTADPSVHSALEFDTWQRRRLRPGAHRHLIVLQHDGGEVGLLGELAEVLRGCQQDERFHILVAGEARTAALKFGVADNSYFSGMPDEQLPALRPAELQALLGCDGVAAAAVFAATGGHPAFVRAIAQSGCPFTQEAMAPQLARAPDVRDILSRRLQEDDRVRPPLGRRHAAHTLRSLLDGKPVRSLEDLGNDLRFPEVRLYYDGMLCSDESGATQFRCEAVARAARLVLKNWDEVQE